MHLFKIENRKLVDRKEQWKVVTGCQQLRFAIQISNALKSYMVRRGLNSL